MDREGFRNRLKQYKEARGLNPLLKYWEWKAQLIEKTVPEYEDGTSNVSTWELMPLESVHYDVNTKTWEPQYETYLDEVVVTADAPFKTLPTQSLAENDYLTNLYFDDLLSGAKNGSKEEIMQIQSDLANKGLFDIDTSNMSVTEVKALQRKIGTEADGIWGKNSRQKYREYNVDGIWGKRTEQAFLKSLLPQWNTNVPTEETEWCAEWVGKKAASVIGDRYKFGILGDAWKMPQNIVQHGGEMIFNIYDESFGNVKTTAELKSKTEKALKTSAFDINNLRVGDVVGIYMPSSDMHGVALREGSTHNTHIGIVTGYDKNGVPIIEHNIHRKLHRDKANKLTGSRYGRPQIATVTRPAYGNLPPSFETQDAKSQYTTETDSPLFILFADSVAGGKEIILKLFPNVDIDELERITLAVQGRETGFMKNKASDQTGFSKLKNRIKEYYRDEIKKKDPATVSSNLSKMKLSSFDSDEKRMLQLNSPKDLEDPKKAGLAALYLLAKNYQYFYDLQQTYPQLQITNDDITYLTELSYNQGMKKLRHIGFTEDGLPALKELEAIREMAKADAKIKDVSSTNFAHLGKVGEVLYDVFGEGHTPYISAAETYKQKLMDVAEKNKQKNMLLAYADNAVKHADGGVVGYFMGGNVGDEDFMQQFGDQVTYKPEDTGLWADLLNWWNDVTGMKNYAYGNLAMTPNGTVTKHCAKYSNDILRKQGYKGITGNAWDRTTNSRMKKIVSGYDGLKKPKVYDEDAAHEYLTNAADNFRTAVDTTALKSYDVIGLYYPDSPNIKKAFEEGKGGETQTHTGHIVVGPDGTHYVVHNVDTHLKMNTLRDMLTGEYEYLPVAAHRPRK